MKPINVLLFILIPSFIFGQIELTDEQSQMLNELINEGNNKHLKEYCQYLDTADVNFLDRKSLSLQTKVYSNKIVQSRSYVATEITDKELFYKLTFDAFKLCPASQNVLKKIFKISDRAANFITNFEIGKLEEKQFANETDYLETIEIQKDANLISNEVLVDLGMLSEEKLNTWTYSYYKFYPRGRTHEEDLFSEDNRVATLTFKITDDKISIVDWNNDTKLFSILKMNLSGRNTSVPPPPPPPMNKN